MSDIVHRYIFNTPAMKRLGSYFYNLKANIFSLRD
ncbi:hypothetical protein EVA_10599 [gut metagenome]|uniref:Uncharacterized protein n=1 Tax=gut metagenome TaxID=749906 RepID=J9G252_9ZZZZ